MNIVAQLGQPPKIEYPDSDGQPMADNTLQFEYIATIKGGLDAVFRDDPNVFVAGDLLWYPVEGSNTIRIAPDVLIAFGRPKGYRGSYMQWIEDNIAPQVVFEILSPGNRFSELLKKLRFYEEYGVEEYYLYNPDGGELLGWRREGAQLQDIPLMQGWVSPRLGVRFELVNSELKIYGPDGRPFATYVEVVRDRDQERHRAERLAAQLKAHGIEPEL
jgi:Uma2 family endonuclease